MNTDRMWRVLATHWEAEAHTEYWCADAETARFLAEILREHKTYGDTTVQVDAPRETVTTLKGM